MQKKIITKKQFLYYKQIIKSKIVKPENVIKLKALGITKEQQRILKTSYNRLNYLYSRKNIKTTEQNKVNVNAV